MFTGSLSRSVDEQYLAAKGDAEDEYEEEQVLRMVGVVEVMGFDYKIFSEL